MRLRPPTLYNPSVATAPPHLAGSEPKWSEEQP